MSIHELVIQYGYIAVAIGCFLEGETVLIAAGFAAHRGMLNLPDVLIIACLASFAGDQLNFWLGRRHGARLIDRFAALRKHAPRIQGELSRHATKLILGIRFMVGLRVAGPVLIGWSGVSPWRFCMLNLVAAAIWAVLIGGAGFAFGETLSLLVADLKAIEEWVLLGLLATGIGWGWLRSRRSKATGKH